MSYVQRHTVSVTTDGSGDATAYTPVVNGLLKQIIYAKTDFADGVDFTITTETTAQNLWVDTNVNASEKVAPREPTADAVGDASLYAAGGLAVEDSIPIADERIKIVVSSGGAAKTGTFHFVLA